MSNVEKYFINIIIRVEEGAFFIFFRKKSPNCNAFEKRIYPKYGINLSEKLLK